MEFTRAEYELFNRMSEAGVTAPKASEKASQTFNCSYDDTVSMSVELDGGTIDFEVGDAYTGNRLKVFMQPDEALRLYKLLGEMVAKSGVEF